MKQDARRGRCRLIPCLVFLAVLSALTGHLRAQNTSTSVETGPHSASSEATGSAGSAGFNLNDFGRLIEPVPAPVTPTSDPLDLTQPGGAAGNVKTDQSDGFTLPDLTDRTNVGGALQMVILLTILSLAPALLVLTTSFTRIVIVLSLLRQALGTQQLPPNQVLVGLAMFMTFLIMAPTYERVSTEAVQPYLAGTLPQDQALDAALVPVREFMIGQITAAGNDETVLMFQQYAREPEPETWGDVSTLTLVPAFVLSELKVAFLMGFKVYLPFLVIDMVISAVLISMGMMMLPPVMISLPFKLLLFVMVDGWHLLVGSLMESFQLSAMAAGG